MSTATVTTADVIALLHAWRDHIDSVPLPDLPTSEVTR